MKHPDDAPIACSLDDVTTREKEWKAVIDRGLRAALATPAGVRLEFDPVLETSQTLLDLVASERECCGWATWTLTSTADATLVEATAGEPGRFVLHAMFEVTP
jgi:hypothetical protein